MKIQLSLILVLFILSCENPPEEPATDSTLGVLHHNFSISEPAREGFEKGLLLLHSFEYDDAGEAFDEAIEADSSELMGYWGSVMTKYKALWGLQNVDAGRAIMMKIDSTPALRLKHAEDELEADFWQGVEILFGEGELAERNEEFSQHMAKLYEKYPSNEEVAAFYSISLLWASGQGFNKENSLLSARIADGILKENPRHPGALHYKIHAFDHPEFANEAQLAADLYADVAPDATHALHMPSHIYLALGRWNDVVSSNEASYGASVARVKRKNLGDGARGYHSYAWLHYGYLQQGRYDDAERLLKDMYQYEKNASNQSARSYLVAMQNAQLAEAPEWNNEISPNLEVNTDDLGIVSQAAHSFFLAHWAFQNQEQEEIVEQISQLKNKISTAALQVNDEGIAMCSAGTTRYAPNQNSVRLARVLLLEQEAMLAKLNGEVDLFEEKLREATELEAQCEYSFGPPDIALPSFEFYGYWLLENQRPQEALVQFNLSLERAPKRVMALKGKWEALKSLNQTSEAESVSAELKEIWNQADSEALKFIAAI